MSRAIGFAKEGDAKNYLVSQGLQWISSNYRCKCGEIDLIMRDKKHLVFVEVRARASNDYGGALASITYQKKRKLIRTAQLYLLDQRLYDKVAVRFDVLCLQGAASDVIWIKNAFGVDY